VECSIGLSVLILNTTWCRFYRAACNADAV